MAYPITLSDQEYAALATEAAKSGLHPEQLLHNMIQRLQTSTQSLPPVTLCEFAEMQYRAGKISHILTKQPLAHDFLRI